ncbi:hypothetical protein D915_003784 [Fasciola hepatica]|uniref:Uncharacterized protein n=1 Tax=Fasciola hepatica TaxID=6192 RepID=A0A4E0S1T4_FASHE|nr:hypothetical protein D915_003784 [Fasciola hepatica]
MPTSRHPLLSSLFFCVLLASTFVNGFYVWSRYPEKRFLFSPNSPAGLQESHPALFRPILYMSPHAKLIAQEDEPTGVPNLMRYG